MSNLTRTANYLADSLEALGFVIMSKKDGEGLPLVAFRLPDVEEGEEERNYDEFAIAHQLRVRGWVVPAYTMAPNTENLKMLRVVVREDFTRNRCDSLISDIKMSQCLLQEMDRESIKRQQDFIHKHHTASGKATHNHPKYRVRSCGTLLCPPRFLLVFPKCVVHLLTAVNRRKNIPSRARLARPTRSVSQGTSGWSTPTINISPEPPDYDKNENSSSADVPISTDVGVGRSSSSIHKSKSPAVATNILRRNPPMASNCLSLELPGGQKLLTVRIGCA